MDARSTAHILLEKGNKVVFTYRRNTSFDIDSHKKLFEKELSSGKGEIDYVQCDITDKWSIKTALEDVTIRYGKIDQCYLLAAQSNVGYSFEAPELTLMATGVSIFYFLDWIYNNSKDTRIFVAMTSELFGGRHKEPCNEDSVFECRSPYSIAKEMGRRWVNYYRQMGLFCCYAISFNHSNQYRGLDFFIRRITNAAAKIALGKLNKISLGNLDFYRDETWADFMCEKYIQMLSLDTPEDFVFATGRTNHGEEFLEHAFGYFNLDWKNCVTIDPNRFRPNEVNKLIGDPSKAKKILNWNPDRINFRQHMEMMCKWDYELESGMTPIRPDVLKMFPE